MFIDRNRVLHRLIRGFGLGYKYSTGQGLPQDEAEAVQWFCEAASQNDAKAQYLLAVMYAHGRGVPQDHVRAFEWATIAAKNPLVEPDTRTAALTLCGSLVAKMTPDQIVTAKKIAGG